jgi:hypothetical protein
MDARPCANGAFWILGSGFVCEHHCRQFSRPGPVCQARRRRNGVSRDFLGRVTLWSVIVKLTGLAWGIAGPNRQRMSEARIRRRLALR